MRFTSLVECEFFPLKLIGKPMVGFNRYMVECEFEYIDKDLTGELSFNRYMVECEYQQLRLSHKINNVLIDTWWNVNTNNESAFFNFSIVLIDTWWNVNVFKPQNYITRGISFNRCK